MDGEIVEVIDAEVRRLPKRKRKKSERYRQYEDAKKAFQNHFSTREFEYFCRAVARKYGI